MRKRVRIPIPPAFVCEPPIDYEPDIIRRYSAYNINLKKEGETMVEKLKDYRAELEAKKAELEANGINNAEVEEKVNAYRQETIAKAQKELDDKLNEINSDINCINNLIAREEAAAETVVNEAE